MYIYRSKIELPAGVSMGGYGPGRHSMLPSDAMAIHGLGVEGAFELCSIDALYAGDLSEPAAPRSVRRIFAASHTHTAPMLDSAKPLLGEAAAQALQAYREAIESAPRERVEPTRCTMYRAEVTLPVYRRFDRPRSGVNRLLTRYAGLFPNDAVPIDRGVYLFVFSDAERPLFVLAYHACHPVTRHDVRRVSADYVQSIRDAVAERFGTPHCLFLLGCTGDVRPNLARKRVGWMPRGRLNWRFSFPPSEEQESAADAMYRDAVLSAAAGESFALAPDGLQSMTRSVDVEGFGPVAACELQVANALSFLFLPFEVSHLYHMDVQAMNKKRFIVSCADGVKGYLPHASQLESGGYEVDGSREYMGLQQRVAVRGSVW